MTKEEIKNLVSECIDFYDEATQRLGAIQAEAKRQCVELLKALGGSIEWNWQEDDAPSILSIHFTDDVADCYITKAYLKGDDIFINMHAYYLGCDDYDDMLMSDEPNADYLELLDKLIYELKD